MTRIYCDIYCDVGHKNKFFFKHSFRSFIEDIYCTGYTHALHHRHLAQVFWTALNANEMVGDHLTIWDFRCQTRWWWSEKMGKLLAPISLQLQKPSSSYKFTTNPHSCAGLAGFPSIWYWQFKTGLFVVDFMTPSALCFAINSRYEGRANKTAIVRAIGAITPDKPLPKCSSASSKSNQIIKQQI